MHTIAILILATMPAGPQPDPYSPRAPYFAEITFDAQGNPSRSILIDWPRLDLMPSEGYDPTILDQITNYGQSYSSAGPWLPPGGWMQGEGGPTPDAETIRREIEAEWQAWFDRLITTLLVIVFAAIFIWIITQTRRKK